MSAGLGTLLCALPKRCSQTVFAASSKTLGTSETLFTALKELLLSESESQAPGIPAAQAGISVNIRLRKLWFQSQRMHGPVTPIGQGEGKTSVAPQFAISS